MGATYGRGRATIRPVSGEGHWSRSPGTHPIAEFRRVVELNLIATFNLNRLQAFHMSKNEPENGERGVMIDTASIAAFEGQIGQVAYTAAKAGIAGIGSAPFLFPDAVI